MKLQDLLVPHETVSGEDIARKLHISRAAVHKQIQKLRSRGYCISAEKKRGYTLQSRPNLLDPEALLLHLKPGLPFVITVRYQAEVASTQTLARALADGGAAEGTVVIAERQTAGYGRLQRSWLSPRGGVWCSLILRPPLPPNRVPPVTLIVSLALCRALEDLYGLQPRIKWPNDIVVDGRKLAGILTEMSAEVDRTAWVVAGIGLNANNDFSGALASNAVSLRMVLGSEVDRSVLSAALLSRIAEGYAAYCREGLAPALPAYHERSLLLGRRIRVDAGNGAICDGIFERIDDDGFLWLKLPDERRERVIAGSIISPERNMP